MARDRWWTRELERVNRAHADERARWDTERRELIDTICALAGRPRGDDTVAQVADQPETEDSWSPFEDPDTIGDELHYTHIEEG